jgi:hypothetical protein
MTAGTSPWNFSKSSFIRDSQNKKPARRDAGGLCFSLGLEFEGRQVPRARYGWRSQ